MSSPARAVLSPTNSSPLRGKKDVRVVAPVSELPQKGDPEAQRLLSDDDERPAWAQGFKRKQNWKAAWFRLWRKALLYEHNSGFGESLELAIRGAFMLLLFAIPRIWGLDKSEESYFYQSKLFDLGAILAFVYTLYGSVGITLNFAVQGIAGTAFATFASYLMYVMYPDGTSGDEFGSGSFIFGAVAGTFFVVGCLFLNFSTSFHIFFVSNFVLFWMAFMDSNAPKRSLIAFDEKHKVLGIGYKDWGGGALDGTLKMVAGATMAVVATVLPYPILSMEKARDSGAETVKVLAETWYHAVEFYLGQDLDDAEKARMMQAMSAVRGDLTAVSQHLEGGWWERIFLFRSKHNFLTKLEAATSRCFERLAHVVDACDREQFEEAHHEMMRPDRCGGAVRSLAAAANELLQLAADCAEAAYVSAEDKEKLRAKMDTVEEAERELTRRARDSLKLVKKEQTEKNRRDMSEEIGEALVDEEIFMFSLCDFGRSASAFSEWLIEHGDEVLGDRQCTELAALKEIFNWEVVLSPARLNFTLRISLSVLLCWLIGFVGYGHTIKARNPSIASTAAVLLAHSTVSPIAKSLGRLQGVVLGLWCGQMTFALLGWCNPYYHTALAAAVFTYVCATLFVYYYDSAFSYIGCLAAAFGTQAFLHGCSERAQDMDQSGGNRQISDLIVAVVVMAVVDQLFMMGRPSELAYKAYADAWSASQEALTQLLDAEHGKTDIQKIRNFTKQAEAFAAEAASEPRFWRRPFETALFSELVSLARVVRTQVTCIEQVVLEKCDSGCSRPRSLSDGSELGDPLDGTFETKKEWFCEAMKSDAPIWRRLKDEVLIEMDKTSQLVKRLQYENAGRPTEAPRLDKDSASLSRRISEVRFGFAELSKQKSYNKDASPSKQNIPGNLLDDELAQKNFVFGCLKTIKSVNLNMQLQVIKTMPLVET